MTATERLRALLDERGVEHYDGTECTYWGDTVLARRDGTCPVYRFSAIEVIDGLSVHLLRVTPEQAVAATLGPGTCEVEESWHGESEMVEYRCTACDEYMAVEVVKQDGAQPPNYCPSCGRRIVGG